MMFHVLAVFVLIEKFVKYSTVEQTTNKIVILVLFDYVELLILMFGIFTHITDRLNNNEIKQQKEKSVEYENEITYDTLTRSPSNKTISPIDKSYIDETTSNVKTCDLYDETSEETSEEISEETGEETGEEISEHDNVLTIKTEDVIDETKIKINNNLEK